MIARSMYRMSVAAALTAAVILLTTGCAELDTPYQKTGPDETAESLQKLRELPSFEETQAQLRQAVEELAAYASSLVPGMTWKWVRDEYPSGCDAPYDQTPGKHMNLRNYQTQGGDTAHGGGISEEAWPAVWDKARELAASLGATETDPFPFKEEIGDRDARFYGANGTVLWLSTRLISSDTGCRLLAADKPAAGSVAPSSEQPK